MARGRSPRVRGRHARADRPGTGTGKIPARAGTTPRSWARSATTGEDPRACGDDRPGVAAPDGPARKIPARAGTTREASTFSKTSGEDPRACGDDLRDVGGGMRLEGRSPRVRGRRLRWSSAHVWARKIPARAGTTSRMPSCGSMGREDPRACGDDSSRPRGRAGPGGRSPRVRGRHDLVSDRRNLVRKIPARAGTTAGRCGVATPCAEDPRACGDDAVGAPAGRSDLGRSPRVRGRRAVSTHQIGQQRKIPARAGTTDPRRVVGVHLKEDPRACGDDHWHVPADLIPRGRSPRVRGRRMRLRAAFFTRRKIPARAGTTGLSRAGADGCSEDPRACGDDSACSRLWCTSRGRSPRVRGRPGATTPGLPSGRKIPARAGTTPGLDDCAGPQWEDPRACGDD